MKPHAEQGLSLVQGVTQKYRGTRDNTVFEVALRGAMGQGLSTLEKDLLLRWVRDGATADGYKKISNIIDEKCANAATPPLINARAASRSARHPTLT